MVNSLDKVDVRTLGTLFFWNVEQFQFAEFLRWKLGDKAVVYSTAQFEDAVLRVAKWLRSSALETGDRIALCTENRPEWHVVDFAAHLAGVVLVPIYPTLAAHQMEQILAHSGARVIFAGTAQMERVRSVEANLPDLQHLVSLDPEGGVENLPALLAGVPPANAAERAVFRESVLAEDPDALATIVYTSGTTGTPKGVMLSHGNVVSNVLGAIDRLPDRRVARALSVLPLSHVLERVLCYGYFLRGVPIAYGDPYGLKELLPLYRPEVMGAVPRMLEKMRDAIQSKIAEMPAHRQKISQFLQSVGADYAEGNRTWKAKLHPLADALMFRKVRGQMGGLEVFVCGGAWLNPDLERYFRSLGFTILQGYGLTETSPVIAVNEFGEERVGSVGRAINGVEIQVDTEGEILARGPNVMKGYYRDPEATGKVFRDGWFVTGDLGRLDEKGFLVITGRRKEMLLLSNGKNVYYAPIEQALGHCPFIRNAFVVGEGRNYTGLIIVPNMAALLQHAAERGILVSSEDELLLSSPILELYRESLDTLQAEFARFEQCKRFCFLREDALLDVDLVTPTEKVRRSVLERKYAKYIDQLYRQEQPFLVPTLATHPAGAPVASTPVS